MTATPTVYDDESPTRRRVRRLITTVVLLLCGVGLVVAAQHTERGDKEDTAVTGVSPAVVQLVAPMAESNVLSQAQIIVGLDPRYSAKLAINGVPIPESDLQDPRATPQGQVIFTPGPGHVLQRLGQGRNCVEATIFRVDGTPEDIQPVRWCFNVT